MSDLTFTITNAGRAALLNAQHLGTAPTLLAACGITATAVTPSVSATSLPGEIKRITTLSGDSVAEDTIHLIVRDESDDVYQVRSLALYLADGTLFAIYGQTAPILEKSAGSMLLLAVDIRFADIAAASLTFGDTDFLNPPATLTSQGVVELATDAETASGTDPARAVTPKGLKSAFNGWITAALTGFDADKLDGQHGAYYADIPARLGFTPFNAANFTPANILGQLATADGSGSGLDADLVDGLQGADLMANRGSVATASVDSATLPGFYLESITGGAQGLLTFNAGGSIGPVQMRFHWNGGLTFRNKTDNSTWSAWRTLWHSASDGAGSGLDADLLDGQQGSYYTNIAARLGFTPYNAADFTGANILAQLTSADGAGSGLDADLLDGQQGSYYTDIAARLGFTPFNAANFTGTNIRTQLLTADGAGSGLDADLLDGLQGADYAKVTDLANYAPASALADYVARADMAASIGAAGYQKFASGLIMQWGRQNMNSDAYSYVTFPIAFPTACVMIQGGIATEVGNNNAADNGPLPSAVTTTQATFWANRGGNAWWIALGY